MAGIIGMGDVADLMYGLKDFAQGDLSIVPAYPCAMGSIVDLDLEHPGQRRQALFIQPDAGRAGDSLEYQQCLADIVVIYADKGLLNLGVVVGLRLSQEFRYQLLPGGGIFGAKTIEIGETAIDNRPGDRDAARATHRLQFTVNFDLKKAAWGRGQAAVKTAWFVRGMHQTDLLFRIGGRQWTGHCTRG